MLVQFVLIVFAMFAVLSLIIDVGYARVTQAEMQIAADSAALEGLRKRDVGVFNPATGQTVNDAFASDCLRRAAANRLVHWVFDDDFDVPNGDTDYQFGAGPIIDLTDGVTNLHALQTISVPDAHVFKPDLQLNQQNAAHGDMVSGRFFYAADPAPPEGTDYARTDFTPNPTTPEHPPALAACPPPDEPAPDPWPLSGSGTLTSDADSAFLVRVRRSNEFQAAAGQAEPDVASSGPALPLVFGRGTTVFGDDAAGGYSVRRDGLTVRATAIAAVRPAAHVGMPQANPFQPGVTAFTLRDTFVQTLNALGAPATINPLNGVICSGVIPPANIAACVAAAPTAVGRFVSDSSAISTVGRALPAPAAISCGAANALAGYGPVYSLMTSGTNRIIGFTRIGLSPDPGRPPNPVACPAVISRGVSVVAASNVSAVLAEGLPLPVNSQPAEVVELLNKYLVLGGAIDYAPVLAPVLAR